MSATSAAAAAPGLPHIVPAEPVATYVAAPGAIASGDDDIDEPAVPDEARARIIADASADTAVAAGPDTILHVRFERSAAPDRLVSAMEGIRALLRDRPGGTRVVIHVPTPGPSGPLPMELRRGVAYDTELVAEVRRRFGDGLVDLHLGTA